MLDSLGFCHENEKLLDMQYVVDIFVPENALFQNSSATVIEIDGPTHFESYLQVRICLSALIIHWYIIACP